MSQQQDTTKVYNIQTITIGAEKFKTTSGNVPNYIVPISQADIQFQNNASSADLLQNKGGVFVQKSQGGGGSPVIRGFEANKILLVVDGVRMNNAIFRGGHLQNVIRVNNEMLQKVEIINGPGSLIYGSDAMGGVIHFSTISPRFSDSKKTIVHATAMARYSSALQESTGHVNFSLANNKWGSTTAFTYALFDDMIQGKSDNFLSKDYPLYFNDSIYVLHSNGKDSVVKNDDVSKQRRTGYTQYNIMQKLMYNQKNATHTLAFHYSNSSNVNRFDRLSEFKGGNPVYSEWYYGPEEWASVSYIYDHFAKTKIADDFKITLAYQQFNESRISRRFKSNNQRTQQEKVDAYTLNFDAYKMIKSLRLQYGIEGIYNEVASTANTYNISSGVQTAAVTRYPDGGSKTNNIGAYANTRYYLNSKIAILAGTRVSFNSLTAKFSSKEFFDFPFTNIDQNNTSLTGAVGLNYYAKDKTKITIMIANAFRTPNVDDASKVFESADGVIIVPNSNLKPEYTYNTEVTLNKVVGSNFEFELNAHYNMINNLLTLSETKFNGADSIVYDGSLSKVFTTVNKDKAYITGGTAAIDWFLAKNFKLSTSFTYTYGRIYTDTTLAPLDHIPPMLVRAAFGYNKKKLQVELYSLMNSAKPLKQYRLAAEDNELYATPDGMPAWMTINLKASYNITKNFSVNAGIENILDTQYRYFSSGISAPGRNFIGSIRYQF